MISNKLELFNVLKAGIARFDTTVPITYFGDIRMFLNEFFTQHPEYAYYIKTMSASSFGMMVTLNFTYHNTEVPIEHIKRCESERNVLEFLKQFVSGFRSELVVLVKNISVFNNAYSVFHEREYVNHPDLISSQAAVTADVLGIGLCMVCVKFNYSIEKILLLKNKLDTKKEVNAVCGRLFLPSMPDEVKIFLAHNYLAQTVRYVNTDDVEGVKRARFCHTAYGALINKQCVCQGYAEAFKLLMDHENVPCVMATGLAGDVSTGKREGHAWNIVTLNGGSVSYHIDVTWDSCLGAGRYDYFGKNDSFMRTNREWTASLYPSCNSTTDLLLKAKTYIRLHRSMFDSHGIPKKFYDV